MVWIILFFKNNLRVRLKFINANFADDVKLSMISSVISQ